MNLWRSLARTRPTFHKLALSRNHIRWHSTGNLAPSGRVLGLTSSLRKRLLDDRHHDAVDYFYKFMKETKLRPEQRFEAYSRSIRLFVVHGLLQDAYSLYSRMQDEGFIPPFEVQASMFVLQKLSTGDSTEALLEAAQKAFADEAFDEEGFRYLLRILASVTRLPPSVFDDLIQLFIQSQKQENYALSPKTEALLAVIRTRRGWQSFVPKTDLPSNELTLTQRASAREQEIEALQGMADKDPEIAPLIHSTIRRIQHTNGTYDRVFYNIIISALADRLRFADVVSLYNMMLRGDKTILPDAYTFGTLIRLVTRLSGPRTIHTRKFKAPKDLPTMRTLYRDMVYCHRIQTFGNVKARTPVIKGTLLNKVLRGFVASGDYAAAYVVLKSYEVFKIPITLETYRSAMGEIMRRIQRELPYLQPWVDLQRYWAYRFLGSPETIPKEIDVRLIDGVLNFGSEAALQLDPVQMYTEEHLQNILQAAQHYTDRNEDQDVLELTYRKVKHVKPKHPSYRVPTAICILGLVDPGQDLWDAQPLVRITKRALLASRPRHFLPSAKVVSMEIRYARTEMVPVFKPPSKEIKQPQVQNV